MQNMSPIQTFSVALEIQAGKMPVAWTVRDLPLPEERRADGSLIRKARTERLFLPQVKTNKHGEARVEDLEDPLAARAQLFRAFNGRWNEDAALSFLNRVGAFLIDTAPAPQKQDWEKGTHAKLAYRHRYLGDLQVLPVTLEDLKQEAAYWYEEVGQSGKTSKHKRAFAAPPSGDDRPGDVFGFASGAGFLNTLPVSLEWRGSAARAVIETLSARELLTAAAWAEVVADLPEQVCARCSTRFRYPRMRKHCPGDCAHLAAVQKYKRKKAAEKMAAKRRDRESLNRRSSQEGRL